MEKINPTVIFLEEMNVSFSVVPSNCCQGNSSLATVSEVPSYEVYVEFAIIVLLSALGALNNMIIMFMMCLSAALRKRSHLLVVNLALMDFIMSIAFCPLYACALLLGRWPFSHTVCVYSTALMSYTTGVSLLTNFAIAINRCILAKNGPLAERLTTTASIVGGIIIIWIFVFLLTVLPFILHFLDVEFNPFYSYCVPSFDGTPYLQWVTFYTATYSIALLGPIFGSLICYVIVINSVRGSMLFTRSDLARRRYIRTSKNMGYVFATFCVCWLPDTLHFVIDPNGTKMPIYITRILVILFLANSALNPFIFAWKFPAFQKTARDFVNSQRRTSGRLQGGRNSLKTNGSSPMANLLTSTT